MTALTHVVPSGLLVVEMESSAQDVIWFDMSAAARHSAGPARQQQSPQDRVCISDVLSAYDGDVMLSGREQSEQDMP